MTPCCYQRLQSFALQQGAQLRRAKLISGGGNNRGDKRWANGKQQRGALKMHCKETCAIRVALFTGMSWHKRQMNAPQNGRDEQLESLQNQVKKAHTQSARQLIPRAPKEGRGSACK